MVGGLAEAIAEGEQQRACTLLAVLPPRRRALDEAHGLLEEVGARPALGQIAERLEAQLAVPVLGGALGEEDHARIAGDGDEHAGELLQILRLGALGGVGRPQLLLVEREAVNRDRLPVVADDLRAALGIRRDRHDPGRLTHERLR